MVFSSVTFLIYFLPLFIWIYLIVPKKAKNITALLFSVLFYAWGAPKFIFILIASTIVDFYLVRFMHNQESTKRKKLLLTLSILLNVGLLAYFKYANFFVENLNTMLTNLGMGSVHWTAVALPIGISFYTFQTLTYSIDIYRGIEKPLKKVTDYLLYIMLFPQMIAGPIVRFSTIAKELVDRSSHAHNILQGIYRFSLGLAKKVLIANQMGFIADAIMAQQDLSSPQAWIGIVAYAFQIYFDFSGYSDMAIGLGKMMGFNFPENFNNPYISTSITEFWRRWHITLGTWMRDYLYIPLGGNRNGVVRNYINLTIVFLISGLWHGASWNFVIWGAYHGVFLVLDRLFLKKILDRLPKIMAAAFTFVLVLIGWVFFRLEHFDQAIHYIGVMFSFAGSADWSIAEFSQWVVFIPAILFSIITLSGVGKSLEAFSIQTSNTNWAYTTKFVLAVGFLVFSISWLTSSAFNPFIYFRF